MPGALNLLIALVLLIPVLYVSPILLQLIVRTYGYTKIAILVFIYLTVTAYCVYIMTSGYWLPFFISNFLFHLAGVIRFKGEFKIQIRKSINSMRALLGLER
jgi:hypothetical protein